MICLPPDLGHLVICFFGIFCGVPAHLIAIQPALFLVVGVLAVCRSYILTWR